jgi:hypothetical protein
MSGPENLKGFDYQITYSLLKTIELIKLGVSDCKIIYESLEENEEDFNIILPDGSEYHQLKKRIEGNHWTPGDLKSIFEKFLSKSTATTNFFFVTNGTANPAVKKLKELLYKNETPSDDLLKDFLPEKKTLKELKELLKRTTILTRHYSSEDDENPAKLLKIAALDYLNQPPFSLKQNDELVYNNAWKITYDLAREAKTIDLKNLLQIFEKIGIEIENTPWLSLPKINDFKGRKEEIEIIKSKLQTSRKLIINGINGIGKTWITTRLIFTEKDLVKKTCWIQTNRWTTIDRFIFLVSSFLYANGNALQAEQIRKSEIADRIPSILNALKKTDFTIVIDSVNSGNSDFIAFVTDLVNQSLEIEHLGKLIISSTKRLFNFSEADFSKNKVSEYNLLGFSLKDTNNILIEVSDYFEKNEIEDFHNSVGGHPISIFFLKELILRDSITKDEFTKIKLKSIENARDWIIEKSIQQLSETSKNNLLNLSVIDEIVTFEEAELLLNSVIKPKYLLRELHEFNLISLDENGILLHDSIREVALNMLTKDSRYALHKKLADYYFAKMKPLYGTDEGVDYDLIMKWGYHTECLKDSSYLEEKYSKILQLKNIELDALWAISRFGYPFDFKSENLKESKLVIKNLLAKKLIKENENDKLKYSYRSHLYVISNLDFWDECLVVSLCISRALSYHLGYIPIFKPNHSWNLQGQACWWEHCIEFMPLPPIPKQQRIDHLKFIEEKLERGEYADKTEEHREMLREWVRKGVPDNAPEKKDVEMEKKSCPIFGHCCPDGKKQAQACRKEFNKEEKRIKTKAK